MTRPHQAFLIIALLVTLSACGGSTPLRADKNSGPCDMSQVVGACAVRIEIVRGKATICGEQDPAAMPICMSVSLDLTSTKDGYMSRKLLLTPGQCRTVGTSLVSAAQASCDAYAARAKLAANESE